MVEDNEVNRKIVCRLLTRAGFEVDTANDGLQAVSFVDKHSDKIGLIIMDIEMVCSLQMI